MLNLHPLGIPEPASLSQQGLLKSASVHPNAKGLVLDIGALACLTSMSRDVPINDENNESNDDDNDDDIMLLMIMASHRPYQNIGA